MSIVHGERPRVGCAARIGGLCLGLALLFCAPSAALGASTLGPVPTNPDPSKAQAINEPPETLLFTAAGPPGVQLASPIAGIVTRWNLYTNSVGTGASVRLRVLAVGADSSFTVVASGPIEPVAPIVAEGADHRNVLHTFTAHVPIAVGQMVGFSLDHQLGGGGYFEPVLPVQSVGGWKYGYGYPAGENTPTSASFVNEQWVALNAVVEPDADGDLFGDESQDNCPGVSNPSQADADGDGKGDACDTGSPAQTPDTKIGKGPKSFTAKGAKAAVKVRFSATVPGAGFECKLDKKKYRPCKSPKTYRVKPGRHVFKVRALAGGIVDSTPAVKRFKVVAAPKP